MLFNVGDRVKYTGYHDRVPQGTEGKVVLLHRPDAPEVKWDNGYWANGKHHFVGYLKVIQSHSENIPEEW